VAIRYPADYSYVLEGKKYTPKYAPGGGTSSSGMSFTPFSNQVGRSTTTSGFCATEAAKKLAAAQCTITSATSGMGAAELPVKVYDAGIFDSNGVTSYHPCKILQLPTCPGDASTRAGASIEEKTASAAETSKEATDQNKTNTMLLIGGIAVLGLAALAIHQKWI
jgi:hypothetical protein